MSHANIIPNRKGVYPMGQTEQGNQVEEAGNQQGIMDRW